MTSQISFTLQESNFRIPVIEFNRYREASSSKEKLETAKEIVDGFKEAGFIYLSGHGIPDSTIDHTFQKVRLPTGPRNVKI